MGRSLMDISKISIVGLYAGGEYRVRVRYSPYALFDIQPDGIHRWKGITDDLPFIGDNSAVKVLRQDCTFFPQGYWGNSNTIATLAHNGVVVGRNNVCYFIHIHNGTPYFMASEYGKISVDSCCTLARLTDDGLQLCCGVHKDYGIAIEGEFSGRLRVWSVK